MESENPVQSGGWQPVGAASETPQSRAQQAQQPQQTQPAQQTEQPQQSPETAEAPDAPDGGQVVWRRTDEPAPTQPWPLWPDQSARATGHAHVPAIGAGGWQPTESAVPTWHPADPTAPHPATSPYPATMVAGPSRRSGRVARWLTAGVAGAVLVAGAGVAGGLAVHALDHSSSGTSTSVSAVATNSTSGGSVTAAAIVAAVEPSVVTIAAQSQGGTSEGSGVIVRADGMVVTNYHVISGAAGTITVTFHDGTSGTATVVASDPTNDLALLQVAGASGLTPINLADSSGVQVGDDVIAIGNPLGLGISASEGIVSALDRPVTISTGSQGRGAVASSVSYKAIQTDAAVNEGNSGGALVNANGQLVGITSAIATSGTSTGNLGVAFAIPANQVQSFLTKSLT